MLLRWYAILSGALVATYLAWPYDLRQWPFLIVTLGAMPAIGLALRRSPAGLRLPWWLMLGALGLYNAGNVLWILSATVGSRPTGDGGATDLIFTLAGMLVLGSAVAVVVQRGRGDFGGVIDSAITAVALGGVLWDAVMLPALTSAEVPTGRQVNLFIGLIMVTGTLGAMLRVSIAMSTGRVASVRLFTVSIGLTLVGQVIAALTIDPATGTRPDWTNMVYLAAYAVLGCAALHPSVAGVTMPSTPPEDRLTRGRLTFLGMMLALAPLVGGGRALAGLPTDGVLIAVSSSALIPLVMVRISRLSAQRLAAEQALHRLATRDTLTGLPNRAALLAQLATELSVSRPLTVFFCDLDGFKPVNDRRGHAVGDELLIGVAARLRGCVREGDLVSRFGGDEFVIVCHGPDAVPVVSDRIAEMVSRPFEAGGEQVRIGVSVGVAGARAGDSTDELIHRADLAMYEAKKSKAVGTLSLVSA
ncbi:MAG: GGDEF domain-containing protein [Actinoplanes sp.]